MSTLAKDIARGYGRAFVIRMIAVAIGLPLGCLLVGAILLIVNAFHDRPWIIAIITGGLLALVFGGSSLFVLISVLRRKAQMDAVFVPLGLAGDAYQTYFRQYHGQAAGRTVSVYFYRGPFLEIELPTSLQTRLGVTSAVYLLLTWLWNPDYGGRKDWDLFAPSAFGYTLLAGYLLVRILVNPQKLRAGGLFIIVVSLLHTGAWIFTNTRPLPRE